MGTYTANYNWFMPSVGEQGWGELVNNNFTTIDTTMSGLNTRVGTLETEADAIEARVAKLETGDFDTIKAKRIGVVSTTGYSWSEIVGIVSTSYSMGMSSASGSKNVPLPPTGLTGYDTFVNTTCTYTITVARGDNTGTTTGTLTVTDCVSGKTYTTTTSASRNGSNSVTLVAPVLCSMNLALTSSNTWSYSNSQSITVTRNNSYYVVGR